MVILDEELGISDEERLNRLERGADDLELRLTALLDHFGGTEDGGHGRERPRRDHRTMLRRAWDEKHLRSVGCKLSAPVAARFKRLCDDAGLTRYEVLRRCVMQVHHYCHRSQGGNDTLHNLITLCWRCHAIAHGTRLPEYPDYMTTEEVEQACAEYLGDMYLDEWWPYK